MPDPLLPLSRALAPTLEWRASCPSTNSELVARAAELPDLAVLATDTQTAGRGRLDRVWSTPPGSALAVSVLVRHDGGFGAADPGRANADAGPATPDPRRANADAGPATPDPRRATADPGRATPDPRRVTPDPRRLGWLPLVAGVAMTRAVRALGVAGAALKWPNDVLVETGPAPGKLSGILTELTPHGVVIGAGLNLTAQVDELPVPTATSLALQGVPAAAATAPAATAPAATAPAETAPAAVADEALAAYLGQLWPLIERWRAEPEPARLRALVEPELSTLGRGVRVDRPGQPVLIGSASGLDDDGRLLVRPADTSLAMLAVAAGDVTHLRYE